MIAPAAEYIEEGEALISNTPTFILVSQRKELEEWHTGLTEDFKKGYELGLSTARAVNVQTPGKVL